MQYVRVKNWERFQHYKDRSPPWIKLHRELLNNYEFACLQDASKLHLMLIWLLASQTDNRLPNDPAWVQKQIGVSSPPDLNVLIKAGFLVVDQDASDLLAGCYQSARLEEAEAYTSTETEIKTLGSKSRKTKSEPTLDDEDFERLWMKRPPRAGGDPKKSARQAFSARRKEGATVEEIEQGMERYHRYSEAVGNLNTQFVMQLATFLGPDRHYQNGWTPPATAQTQREAVGEVAKEKARRMIFGDDNVAPNPFGFGDVLQGELA